MTGIDRARVACAVLLAACAHPPAPRPAAAVPWAASHVDWSHPPDAAPARLVAPPIVTFALRDGIRVLLVENHRLPVVAVATVHASAGSCEDGALPGLAALVVDLLDDGAGGHDGRGYADAVERAGARLDLEIATDHATAQLVTVSDHFTDAVGLLADAIRRPRLADADVARVRGEHAAAIAAQRARPRVAAAQLFDRVVFGAHAYAHAATGTPEGVAAITPADVRAFWARTYTPNTTTIVIAGDITRELAEHALDHAFGDWVDPRPAPPPPPAPIAARPALAYIDVPGADSTVVIAGRLAPPSGDAGQLAADVENMIVGGTAGARLDRELHDRLAVALGPSTSYWRGEVASTWAFAATFSTASTADALRTSLAVIDQARTADASPDELAHAREHIERAVGETFDTTEGTVRALIRIAAQRLPLDHYATLSSRLAAITPAGARAAVTWTGLSIVVVGDWAAIGPALRQLGLPVTTAGP